MSYMISPSCVACEVDDGIAILDLRSNTYFGVNSVGAEIWGKMSNPVSLDDLTAAIANDYSVNADECRTDIAALLDDMVKHGLVQTV